MSGLELLPRGRPVACGRRVPRPPRRQLVHRTRRESTSEAKTICFTCPVRRPCRDAGMYERHGIWGGLSERERRRRRRELGITLIDDITDPTDHQENQAS